MCNGAFLFSNLLNIYHSVTFLSSPVFIHSQHLQLMPCLSLSFKNTPAMGLLGGFWNNDSLSDFLSWPYLRALFPAGRRRMTESQPYLGAQSRGLHSHLRVIFSISKFTPGHALCCDWFLGIWVGSLKGAECLVNSEEGCTFISLNFFMKIPQWEVVSVMGGRKE